jgi:hypothetical protein
MKIKIEIEIKIPENVKKHIKKKNMFLTIKEFLEKECYTVGLTNDYCGEITKVKQIK